MKDRDFLWCALNLMLDDQEELERLCPECRARALEERCPVCGVPLALTEGSINGSFDQGAFERRKRGEGR